MELTPQRYRFSAIIILIFCVFIQGCSEDSFVSEQEIRSFYQVGMFDAVLDLSPENSQYRGMIYEYELQKGVHREQAKSVYEKIEDDRTSAKRLFLYCFLYCAEQIDQYFEAVPDDNLVTALYTLHLLQRGEACTEMQHVEVCNDLKVFVDTAELSDIYFELGSKVYRQMIEQKRNRRDFQFPYYLLMKSYVNGNRRAKEILDAVPDRYSLVPKPNSKS